MYTIEVSKMAVVIFLFLCILQVFVAHCRITYISARFPVKGKPANPGTPWPYPKDLQETNRTFILVQENFHFSTDVNNCDILDNAFTRYRKLIQNQHKTNGKMAEISQLKITIKDPQCDMYPFFGMDESYKLDVDSNAVLSANTVWGVLRGLETFSQLIHIHDGHLCIRETHISDSPRFPHRGLLVDTARHYIPMYLLYKHLDAMSWNKFNVFHWHIVDDQSFPYVSKSFPELSNKGAYSSKHVYTQKDVADIIEYARLRGIRVVPEFDTPGHAQGWGKAFKNLLTECWASNTAGVANYSVHAAYENLDPSKEETFQFLNKFFGEIKDVFKDEFLHMGMDEAHYACWQSSPVIKAFMKSKGFDGNYPMLEKYFNDRLLKMISDMGKRYMVWQDPVDHEAPLEKHSLVHIWKGGLKMEELMNRSWLQYLQDITLKGYDVIFSSCWYLNYIHYGEDWPIYYKCDPQDFSGTDEQKNRVKGGEATMWSEFVDWTNFLSRYWPRASAIAERLWSPAHLKDEVSARRRLHQHRCRMLGRGINAEPIHPGTCGDLDFTPQ